jgi:hypothetical protein
LRGLILSAEKSSLTVAEIKRLNDWRYRYSLLACPLAAADFSWFL